MMDIDDEEEENNMGVVRYPVMPSLVALQQMRNRLQLASLGRKLMKWTMLATGKKMRKYAFKLSHNYENYTEEVSEAFILLARCRYFYPQLNKMVETNVNVRDTHVQMSHNEDDEEVGIRRLRVNKAQVSVRTRYKMVSGVKIVKFEIIDTGFDPYEHLGISVGGQMIAKTKLAWHHLLLKCISIVELRKDFAQLVEANLNATKKLQVLRNIVVPRTVLSIRYIKNELEEVAREDFYRLKKVLKIANKIHKSQIPHLNETPELATSIKVFKPIENEMPVKISHAIYIQDDDTNDSEDNALPHKSSTHAITASKSNVERNVKPLVAKMPTSSHQVKSEVKFEELKQQLTEILKITKDMEGSLFMRTCVSDFLEMAEFLKEVIDEEVKINKTNEDANKSQQGCEEIDIEITKSDLEFDSYRVEILDQAKTFEKTTLNVKSEDNILSKHRFKPFTKSKITLHSVSSDTSLIKSGYWAPDVFKMDSKIFSDNKIDGIDSVFVESESQSLITDASSPIATCSTLA